MNFIKNEYNVAIKHFSTYLFISQQDLKNRFRRSKLGILWIAIHLLVFTLGAGFIWSKVLGTDPSIFIPFLTVGFVIWNFISGSTIDGCHSFINSSQYIKQFSLPYSIFIFRTFLVNVFYFSISIAICFFVMLVFGKLSIYNIIYCLPGLLILLLYAYGIIGAMAYLGTRYRDIHHALPGIFSLLFVMTPVMYSPELLIKKGVSFIVYGNPFASLIEIIRVPLLDGHFSELTHYLISIIFGLSLIIFRVIIEKRWRRYISFWL